MKTEEEARKCWCPMARVNFEGAEGSAGWNRLSQSTSVQPQTYCIASECMAWREGGGSWKGEKGGSYAERPTHVEAKYEPVGYCGLAGKP